MRSNLKRIIQVGIALGLTGAVVACTATAGQDTICIGRDSRCSDITKPQEPPKQTGDFPEPTGQESLKSVS